MVTETHSVVAYAQAVFRRINRLEASDVTLLDSDQPGKGV